MKNYNLDREIIIFNNPKNENHVFNNLFFTVDLNLHSHLLLRF